MKLEIKKSDIKEYIKYGFECPKCGEWQEVDSKSDITECYDCGCEIEIRSKEDDK